MPYEQEIPPYGDLVQPPQEVNDLARMVLGVCIDVHRELGAGLPEQAYERALAMEFDERGAHISGSTGSLSAIKDVPLPR